VGALLDGLGGLVTPAAVTAAPGRPGRA
jgi:hypothetical protein